jgi:hypothetical protein
MPFGALSTLGSHSVYVTRAKWQSFFPPRYL